MFSCKSDRWSGAVDLSLQFLPGMTFWLAVNPDPLHASDAQRNPRISTVRRQHFRLCPTTALPNADA
jgi:hypothetical protein